MRASILTAGLLAATALLTTLPASAHQQKVTCLCDCPDDAGHKAKPHTAPQRHAVRRAPRRAYAEGYYDYGAFGGVSQNDWHGEWRQARNDAMIGPMPQYDSYAAPAYDENARIDDRGWTGGVGGVAHGGGGGGGGDMGGSVVLANGGSAENGPTYNSYGESFQFNPSQAGPFQPRLMGGFAPSK